MKIKKAVIPVAGMGTRFLPYTKTIPKEMLPVFDLPSIHFIVKEALDSGIEEVLFVTAEGKESINHYFEPNLKLEKILKEKGEIKLLEQLHRVPSGFKKSSVIQKTARGLGDAVLHAERFVGKEDFAVFLPDDIIFSRKPAIKQMIDAMDKYGKYVVAVERVPDEMISSYGIIKPRKIAKRIFEVIDMEEKPSKKTAFSNLGIVGRYILPSTVFFHIKNTKPGAKGEIQLTDALRQVMRNEGMIACEFEGIRCDTGDKYGFLKAGITYAAFDPELKRKLKKDIYKILK